MTLRAAAEGMSADGAMTLRAAAGGMSADGAMTLRAAERMPVVEARTRQGCIVATMTSRASGGMPAGDVR